MPGYYEIEESAKRIQKILPVTGDLAVVLGSGLSPFADRLTETKALEYSEIPNFPVSTVEGHRGRLVTGNFSGKPILVMQGRFHLYEGYSAKQVVFPIRVLRALGIKKLLLTNAAGAVNTAYAPGDLMLITDHLNCTGQNPLTGANDERLGSRFPDLTEVYSARIRKIFVDAASAEKIPLRQGVYIAVPGPAYETPAEIKMYRILGADACGMSTVPEAIAARHIGLETAGLSCITNMGAGILTGNLSHDEVTHTAGNVMDAFVRLMHRAIAQM